MTEGGHSRCFHTLHFGTFDPDTALRSARQYAHDRQISVTDALLSLTTDMVLDANGGAKKILVGGDPDMTQALSAVFSRCPAAAARLTFDADRSQTAVTFFRPPGSPAHFGDADFLSFATRPRRAACQSGGAGMLPCRAGRHTGASLWRTAGEQERGPLRIGNGP